MKHHFDKPLHRPLFLSPFSLSLCLSFSQLLWNIFDNFPTISFSLPHTFSLSFPPSLSLYLSLSLCLSPSVSIEKIWCYYRTAAVLLPKSFPHYLLSLYLYLYPSPYIFYVYCLCHIFCLLFISSTTCVSFSLRNSRNFSDIFLHDTLHNRNIYEALCKKTF